MKNMKVLDSIVKTAESFKESLKKVTYATLIGLVLGIGGNIKASAKLSSPACPCQEGYCCDTNWDLAVDVRDFQEVISTMGNITGCLDNLFYDGYTDPFDVWDWDWNLSHFRTNLCESFPLSPRSGNPYFSHGNSAEPASPSIPTLSIPTLDNLLILGKRAGSPENPQPKLNDALYVLDSNGSYKQSFLPRSERCNVGLMRGSDANNLYQISSDTGILRFDGTETVPPSHTAISSEPRYNESAEVYIGIGMKNGQLFGRPIRGAEPCENYIYVVPVVIEPNTGEPNTNQPYAAAAKLELNPGSNPPYTVKKIYDAPIMPSDLNNLSSRNNLREIKVDAKGNVFVTNGDVHGDILWRFGQDKSIQRLNLSDPNLNDYHEPIRSPICMYVSKSTKTLYLSSSIIRETDPNSIIISGLSTKTLEPVRTIKVSNLERITGITEDPITKSLFVVGIKYDYPPQPLDPFSLPPYRPYMAIIPLNVNNCSANALKNSDLALPLSVIWTGLSPKADICGGYDTNGDGIFNFLDPINLNEINASAQYWLETGCTYNP